MIRQPPFASLLILALCLPATVGKAASNAKDVSPLLASILDRSKVPGMVAVVVEGEGIVCSGAAGLRRIGSPEQVTLTDKFHIGSCTKAMTATLCAMLVEGGGLSWDTTLSQAFPDLESKMHPDYRDVTLAQLLTHRAGLPSGLNAGELWGLVRRFNDDSVAARRALVEGVLSREPAQTPGAAYLYSNAGYSTAGHLAETVAGKRWEELMARRLFKPLSMSSAGFGAPGTAGPVTEPRGHTARGLPVEPGPVADNPPAIGPSGTVHCSIVDWSKFVALHLRGARGEAKLLALDTFARLHAPAAGPGEKYAMGWGVTERAWAGGTVLQHAGSNTLWYSVTWLAPKRDFAVLVCCNQGGDAAAKACDDASAALIEHHLQRRR